MTVTCSGFQTGETVRFTWDSSSGKTLDSETAGDGGAATGKFRAPETPGGAHKIVVSGLSSGGRIDLNVTVKPSVSLSPKTGESGDKVTVTLRGFKAGEIIDLKWYVTSTSTKTVKRGVVASSLGTIKTTFNVPSGAANGSHKVDARGRGGSRAYATFTVSGASAASVEEPTVRPTRTPRPEPTPESGG